MANWPGDFVHLLNPNRDHRKSVASFFRRRPDLRCYWVERETHPSHLETLLQWAAREGEKRVAIWGGDGTLSRAVQALYDERALDRTDVALVPSGTGNDFARKLGIRDSGSLVSDAEPVEVRIERFDLGLLRIGSRERVFVNNAGFGRSAAAVRRPRPNALRDILSFQPRRLGLEWKTPASVAYETRDVILGIVFNSPYFNRGLCFDPLIAPDDGVLTAFLEPPRGAMGLLFRFLKGRFGAPLARPDTIRLDAVEIRVEADAPLYPQVDGEPAALEGARRLDFGVLPGKLALARWDVN